MSRKFDLWFADSILCLVGFATMVFGLNSGGLYGSGIAAVGICVMAFGVSRAYKRITKRPG